MSETQAGWKHGLKKSLVTLALSFHCVLESHSLRTSGSWSSMQGPWSYWHLGHLSQMQKEPSSGWPLENSASRMSVTEVSDPQLSHWTPTYWLHLYFVVLLSRPVGQTGRTFSFHPSLPGLALYAQWFAWISLKHPSENRAAFTQRCDMQCLKVWHRHGSFLC
jgi:hypothetical protein